MRKAILILLLLLSISALPAAPSFGYSLSPVGVSFPSSSYGALSLSAVLAPTGDVHAGDITLSVDLSPVKPFFEGVSLLISMPVFRLLDHPFDWAFTNSVIWAPSISAGVQYRLGNEWNVLMGFSPLSFQDTAFIYEFLSPFAAYSYSGEDSGWGWGMYVMRFAYFF